MSLLRYDGFDTFMRKDNSPRLYSLQNNDIFSVSSTVLQYEDNLFYLVEYCALEMAWVRTGEVMTVEEINKL